MDTIEQAITELLNQNIRTIENFPKEGISFKDITPLLQNKETLELTSFLLARPFRGQKVDFVLGLESRGFLFGTNLAQDLHAGFVPVRKPNKLPAEKVQVTYELEYGDDVFEMHKDALKPGSKVIIHDDLIATGGSAQAATDLVKKLNGIVVGYSFVMEIETLNGKNTLNTGVPVHTILKV